MEQKKIWFHAKRYGWGWGEPASWEGWAVYLTYIAFIVWNFRDIDATSHSASDTLLGLSVPFVTATVILIVTCWWKGEKPRWRWGK